MRYDNVKPCPFCGCPAVTVKAISGYFRVKCDGCESRSGYGGSQKEALVRWNKRATENTNGSYHV
ncbi:type I toxin-antitoxin system endodeoxyribonuclease toxin RalR [Salmonella enterica subsp. enterica]|uniref:Type I toxin-antitoxin system endodeoxyribonuclease toxin RalR n=1 Tax=Salmonella enteritidis TaxID=149539 RepID=A0A736V698_SALEN|nr:type I toxin-antitoxin system endodeoxyribonuclease toxin RalR [Salmonella enterica]EAB8633256.1 type I toxin-antitoxin system endodeoxyribonuclease toxin RalR [Salmonella enterica subsp. enterica]EBZ2215211.1 type I toxin-antitoxin system endodeoxyribonuclease toxin RalR [Salmonella enterica subsp. enterica serovar Montevideo]ECA5183279.1 type I toxin-antitoxin system endodeoxyribonuclease toxin RalR [Salmonella enterica subsp. enterica serovar Newport]ECF1963027.1 type I toxin-antitoxin sy